MIDTLRLSPIAFPQNPYHRLLKDYKLVRDSRSDPLRDCQLSLRLFQDEHDALEQLARVSPEELACHHFLLPPRRRGRPREPVHGDPRRALLRARTRCGRTSRSCSTRRCAPPGWSTSCSTSWRIRQMRLPIAYALAWLRVAGGNSVLPPWVWHQFPDTRRLIRTLRDTPCGRPECGYCSEYHDPHRELERHFGFTAFRPEPADAEGGSLQEEIVRAGMRGEHLLAILPTGAGKSLCYQLPALSHFWRTGKLTVVISPLQSLMKDQVDGLVRQGIFSAAALNGLLSMPERKDVLDRVRLGDVSILLVSPEQLRNRSFAEAIRYRDIAAWVFDEAHCLSKWGHDFRTDYLYAARFIRERHTDELPQIACFTATAKLEVIADLERHFSEILGIRLRRFRGRARARQPAFRSAAGAQAGQAGAHPAAARRGARATGAAAPSCSRHGAESAETIAAFLRANGWACGHFHAGLTPEVKKHVQQAFIEGDLRVIAATNAFGMGVDKPDVRLVIHAEVPGSLENYLQEAGRAGRDRAEARCVLLYDEEDVEVQFAIAAGSRLSQKDVAEILKLLRRRAVRSSAGEIVITSGEILADDALDSSIEPENPDADTKVRTAIAWLERARFLRRDENHTRVFPASLKVQTLDEARGRIAEGESLAPSRRSSTGAGRAAHGRGAERGHQHRRADAADRPAQRGMHPRAHALEQLGVLANDLQISVYLRKGIADASQKRLERVMALESALLSILPEQAPDAAEEGWLDLNPRLLASTSQRHSARDAAR